MKIGNDILVIPQESLGAKGFFYVGGKVSGQDGKRFISGQMFVEVYVPKKITKQYPLILFHGAGQTNVNWLGTPDGRMGWADYFVQRGYIVYLAEQPARARSAYHPQVDGAQMYAPLEKLEKRFTSNHGLWERSKLHSQWPKNEGNIGDKTFMEFAAAQVEYLPSNKASQQLVQNVAKELLDKTGPAILLTHSQSGPFGWNIADAFPDLVKGIVALEPSGPPFSENFSSDVAQNYGITELPLHFTPPIANPQEIKLKLLKSRASIESDGWVFQEPAPKLPTFIGIPILLLVSESSYHSNYDHLTSYVLNQCAVQHDFVRLEDIGLKGNGHMMMLENNNLDIAAYIDAWLRKHI